MKYDDLKILFSKEPAFERALDRLTAATEEESVESDNDGDDDRAFKSIAHYLLKRSLNTLYSVPRAATGNQTAKMPKTLLDIKVSHIKITCCTTKALDVGAV